MVVLSLLLHGADARGAEGGEAKDGVEPLQDLQPPGHRLVAHSEVLAQRVEGEGCADELGKAQGQELEIPEILDSLETGDVLADEAAPVLAGPSARLHLGSAEKRLGKASQGQKVAELRRGLEAELRRGERVQPEHVVAPLERVSAEPVEVE